MDIEEKIVMGIAVAVLIFSIVTYPVRSCEDEKVTVQLSSPSMICEVPDISTTTDASVTDAELIENNDTLEASRIELEVKSEEMDLLDSRIDSGASSEVSEVISEALIYDGYEDVEIIPFTKPEEPQEPTLTYLGTYQLTAYAWTGSRCANGNYPTLNYTIASNSIPMGSRVYIEGYGEFVVEDTGGMSSNVIDVYMGDYSTCIQFGRRTADVYLIN